MLHSPLPTPLDSGLRRNDDWGAGLTSARGFYGSHQSRIGVRDTLSYQDWRRSCLPPPLWIPAFAGMTNWGAGMTSARGFQRTPA